MAPSDTTLTGAAAREDEPPGARTPAETAPGRPAPGAQSSAASDPAAAGPESGDGAASGASAGPASGTSAGDVLDDDVRELVAVVAQRDEYLALAQRAQADFENYRKRVARDSEAAHERAVIKLARELLPALDNLDRALAEAAGDVATAGGDGATAGGDGATAGGNGGAAGDGPNQALLDGVRLVRSQLGGALARVGIQTFSPLGQPFDPTREEAISQAPAPEGVASGTVLEVYQPGYTLGESVIRPARVVVAA